MSSKKSPITIRAGHGTLSFLIPDGNGVNTFHPYSVKSGMSLAANLRQAFREEPLLTGDLVQSRLLVSSPALLIPADEYHTMEHFDADTIYGDTITGHKGEEKIITEIPEFDVVSIFPVNSDLKMVVEDHFHNVDTENVMTLMWRYLYKNYYQSTGQKRLFVYFHDKVMDICSFEQHRIRFANSFSVSHAHDALYFSLYVWKQLGMRQQEDEIFVYGDVPHQEWFTARLQTYIKKVNIIESRLENKHQPFDLTLCE